RIARGRLPLHAGSDGSRAGAQKRGSPSYASLHSRERLRTGLRTELRTGLRIGIVVFAHGSRIAAANDAVRSITTDLMKAGPFESVETAFLELGQPDLATAVASLVGRGATRIVVIPYFLTLGTHLERDLPALVRNVARAHEAVEFIVTPPLDGHPALLQILLDRATSAR